MRGCCGACAEERARRLPSEVVIVSSHRIHPPTNRNSRHLIGADGDGDGSLRRFLSFLTHDVFVPSAGAGDAAGLAAGVLVPSHASLSGGSIGSSQPPSLLVRFSFKSNTRSPVDR